jgi:hypothetical protein
MNEKSPVKGLSWERLPAGRRVEIALILGRMAGRQLAKNRDAGAPDHERDDGEQLHREPRIALSNIGQDPGATP